MLRDPDNRAGPGRIALVQADGLLTEALTACLEAAGHEVSVVAPADPSTLAYAVVALCPRLVLLDEHAAAAVELGELIELLHTPGRSIALLVDDVDGALARHLADASLSAVLLKRSTGEAVVAAVDQVLGGLQVFPAGWLSAAHDAPLSPRQTDVLRLLALGLPNDVIARRLYISSNTVKFHVAAIYQRLGVHNRVQAADAARRLLAVEVDATH